MFYHDFHVSWTQIEIMPVTVLNLSKWNKKSDKKVRDRMRERERGLSLNVIVWVRGGENVKVRMKNLSDKLTLTEIFLPIRLTDLFPWKFSYILFCYRWLYQIVDMQKVLWCLCFEFILSVSRILIKPSMKNIFESILSTFQLSVRFLGNLGMGQYQKLARA